MSLEIREIARNNWLRASNDLNFKIITPFEINVGNKKKEIFAFLPKYGSLNGAIIEFILAPNFERDKDVIYWANANSCFYSFLDIDSFLKYDIDYFIELLLDWKVV